MPALHLRFAWRLAGLLLLLATASASAVSTRSLLDDDYAALAQGELRSAALGSDGLLRPTLAREQLGITGAEIVWDVLREERGTLLCATGHGGRLVRMLANRSTDTVTTFAQPEITALARLDGGRTLVATAPGARLYLLGADDRVTTLTALPAALVWRLVPAGDGSVWALTGAEGKLFRLRVKGSELQIEQQLQLRSRNLLACWVDAQGAFGPRGALYVGGQDPGWLYRVQAGEASAEVLFNASAEEVRAIVPVAEGLALAINTDRAPTPQALQLTMRMQGPLGGMPMMNGPRPGGAPGGPPSAGDAEQERALAQAFQQAQQRQGYGPPGSRVIVLRRDGFSRDLWGGPEAPIHDLAAGPDGLLLAAAGTQGRLFGIHADASWDIVADVREDFLIRLVPDGEGLLLTAARNGLVFGLQPQRAGAAEYLSRALDAGKPVRWGQFYLRGQLPKPARVSFRMGNAGDVEADAWTAWSSPVEARHDQPVALPAQVSRYLQYKVQLPAAAGREPVEVDQAEVFFTEPNTAPLVLDLKVVDAGAAMPKGPGAPGQGPKPPQGGSPTAQGQPQGPGGPAGPAPQPNLRDPHSNGMTLNIAWRAVDPNDDTLRYALYFKARDEHAWKLIEDELDAPQMALNVSGVADGYYTFRIVASDELSNPDGGGLQAEKTSDEVLVDNSAPRIKEAKAEVAGHRAHIRLQVEDDWSLLSSVRIDLNNGDAHPVFPVDGIYDQRAERFDWETPTLAPGEYVATINATDRQGNSTTGKVVFTVDR